MYKDEPLHLSASDTPFMEQRIDKLVRRSTGDTASLHSRQRTSNLWFPSLLKHSNIIGDFCCGMDTTPGFSTDTFRT